MVSRARARLTLIELDNILRCTPGKVRVLKFTELIAQQARELVISISSTVSRGQLLIEAGWHIELDEPILSSVAHVTYMIPVRQGSERTYVDGPFRLRKVNEVLAFCDDSLVCFSQSRCFEHLAHCFNNNNNNNKCLVKIHSKRYRE